MRRVSKRDSVRRVKPISESIATRDKDRDELFAERKDRIRKRLEKKRRSKRSGISSDRFEERRRKLNRKRMAEKRLARKKVEPKKIGKSIVLAEDVSMPFKNGKIEIIKSGTKIKID